MKQNRVNVNRSDTDESELILSEFDDDISTNSDDTDFNCFKIRRSKYLAFWNGH